MKAGVGTSPWAVCTTPARAAPSAARSVYASLIDGHAASVDDEVAAVREPEAFVVRADPCIVQETVQAQEVAAGRSRGGIRPFHDRLPDALPGARPADGELVDVRRITRAVTPIRRVVPQERDGRDGVSVQLGDIDLPTLDRLRDLFAGKRERPLLVPALADPDGRLVEQFGHAGHVSCLAPADVQSRSIASPNE